MFLPTLNTDALGDRGELVAGPASVAAAVSQPNAGMAQELLRDGDWHKVVGQVAALRPGVTLLVRGGMLALVQYLPWKLDGRTHWSHSTSGSGSPSASQRTSSGSPTIIFSRWGADFSWGGVVIFMTIVGWT
jgi:hypothetical protein